MIASPAVPSSMSSIPELLVPAGDMEKLITALRYGADAVYLGGEAFGLRSLAGNFGVEELKEAAARAHEAGARLYLTLNVYPGNNDLPRLASYLEKVAAIPLDAYIVSDPGVLALVRDISPQRAIHLSTQANTTNWRSALFWQEMGVSRINLAREMPLEGVREVRRRVTAELEVFVHGALCISYSGRCLLSSVMTGRDANQGECAHPCRWNYRLVEEKRPGEYFPVAQDDSGTFIFNSKDLCLLDHLPALVAAGVDSLKIEGRMKGIHYVGTVVGVYREALDRLAREKEAFYVREEWRKELSKISHRGYTTGFFLGKPDAEGVEPDCRYHRRWRFVAVVASVLPDGEVLLSVRNRIREGDTLQFMGRGVVLHDIQLSRMTDPEGFPIPAAHPNSQVRVRLPFAAEPGDLVRSPSESHASA